MDLAALQNRRRRKAILAASLIQASGASACSARQLEQVIAAISMPSARIQAARDLQAAINSTGAAAAGAPNPPGKLPRSGALAPGSKRASVSTVRDLRSWRCLRRALACRPPAPVTQDHQPFDLNLHPQTNPNSSIDPVFPSTSREQPGPSSCQAPAAQAQGYKSGLSFQFPPPKRLHRSHLDAAAAAAPAGAATGAEVGAASALSRVHRNSSAEFVDNAIWNIQVRPGGPFPWNTPDGPTFGSTTSSTMLHGSREPEPLTAPPATCSRLRDIANAVQGSREVLYNVQQLATAADRLRVLTQWARTRKPLMDAVAAATEKEGKEAAGGTSGLWRTAGAGAGGGGDDELYIRIAEREIEQSESTRALDDAGWDECESVFQDTLQTSHVRMGLWAESVCAHLRRGEEARGRKRATEALPPAWGKLVESGRAEAVAAAVAGVSALQATMGSASAERRSDTVFGVRRERQLRPALEELEPLACAAMYGVVVLLKGATSRRSPAGSTLEVRPHDLYDILSYLEPQQSSLYAAGSHVRHNLRYSREHLDAVAAGYWLHPHEHHVLAMRVRIEDKFMEAKSRAAAQAPYGTSTDGWQRLAAGSSSPPPADPAAADAAPSDVQQRLAERLGGRLGGDGSGEDEYGSLFRRNRPNDPHVRNRSRRVVDSDSDSTGSSDTASTAPRQYGLIGPYGPHSPHGPAAAAQRQQQQARATGAPYRDIEFGSCPRELDLADLDFDFDPHPDLDLAEEQQRPGGGGSDDGHSDAASDASSAALAAHAAEKAVRLLDMYGFVDLDLARGIATDLAARDAGAAGLTNAATAAGPAAAAAAAPAAPAGAESPRTIARSGGWDAGKLEALAVRAGEGLYWTPLDDGRGAVALRLQCLWLTGGSAHEDKDPDADAAAAPGSVAPPPPTALLNDEVKAWRRRRTRRTRLLRAVFKSALEAQEPLLPALAAAVLPRRRLLVGSLPGSDAAAAVDDDDNDDDEDGVSISLGDSHNGSIRATSGCGGWGSPSGGGGGGGWGSSRVVRDEEVLTVARVLEALEALRPGLVAAHPGSWGKLADAAGEEEARLGWTEAAARSFAGKALRLGLLGVLLLAHRPDLPLRLLRLLPCIAAGAAYTERIMQPPSGAGANKQAAANLPCPDAHYQAITAFAAFNFLPGRLHHGGSAAAAAAAAGAPTGGGDGSASAAAVAAACTEDGAAADSAYGSQAAAFARLIRGFPAVWASIALHVSVQALAEEEGLAEPWLFATGAVAAEGQAGAGAGGDDDAGSGSAAGEEVTHGSVQQRPRQPRRRDVGQLLEELRRDVVVAAAERECAAAESGDSGGEPYMGTAAAPTAEKGMERGGFGELSADELGHRKGHALDQALGGGAAATPDSNGRMLILEQFLHWYDEDDGSDPWFLQPSAPLPTDDSRMAVDAGGGPGAGGTATAPLFPRFTAAAGAAAGAGGAGDLERRRFERNYPEPPPPPPPPPAAAARPSTHWCAAGRELSRRGATGAGIRGQPRATATTTTTTTTTTTNTALSPPEEGEGGVGTGGGGRPGVGGQGRCRRDSTNRPFNYGAALAGAAAALKAGSSGAVPPPPPPPQVPGPTPARSARRPAAAQMEAAEAGVAAEQEGEKRRQMEALLAKLQSMGLGDNALRQAEFELDGLEGLQGLGGDRLGGDLEEEGRRWGSSAGAEDASLLAAALDLRDAQKRRKQEQLCEQLQRRRQSTMPPPPPPPPPLQSLFSGAATSAAGGGGGGAAAAGGASLAGRENQQKRGWSGSTAGGGGGGGEVARRQLGGPQWEPRQALPVLMRCWRCAAARSAPGPGPGAASGSGSGSGAETVVTVDEPGMMLALTALHCGDSERVRRSQLAAAKAAKAALPWPRLSKQPRLAAGSPPTSGPAPAPAAAAAAPPASFLHACFQPSCSEKMAGQVLGRGGTAAGAQQPAVAMFPPPEGCPGVALLSLRTSAVPAELVERVVADTDGAGGSGSGSGSSGIGRKRSGLLLVSKRRGYAVAAEHARSCLVSERLGALRVQATGLEGLETAVLLLAQVRGEMMKEKRDLTVVVRQLDHHGIVAAPNHELDEQREEHQTQADLGSGPPGGAGGSSEGGCVGSVGAGAGAAVDVSLELLRKYETSFDTFRQMLPALDQHEREAAAGGGSGDYGGGFGDIDTDDDSAGAGVGFASGRFRGSLGDRLGLGISQKLQEAVVQLHELVASSPAVRSGLVVELVAFECEPGKPDHLLLQQQQQQQEQQKKTAAAAGAASGKGTAAKAGGGRGEGGKAGGSSAAKTAGRRKQGSAAQAEPEEPFKSAQMETDNKFLDRLMLKMAMVREQDDAAQAGKKKGARAQGAGRRSR